jgi:hypothetical protein
MFEKFENLGIWFSRAAEVSKWLYAIGGFSVLGGAGISIWGNFQDSVPLLWIGGAFFVAGFIAILIRVIGYIFADARFAQLYTNRDMLRKQRGSLKTELQKINGKVWIIWHTGKENSDKEIWDSNKIERLILFNPRAESMTQKNTRELYPPIHAPINFNKNLEKIRGDILYTTKRANNVSIPVKWFKYAISNTIIIANPETGKKKKGWARIELSIPYSNIEGRPSILIKESETPKLFRYIVKCYKQIWDASEQISDSDLEL